MKKSVSDTTLSKTATGTTSKTTTCPAVRCSWLFPDTGASDSHFIRIPLAGFSVAVVDVNLEGDGLRDHARHSAHCARSM